MRNKSKPNITQNNYTSGNANILSLSEWLNLNLPPKSSVGIDPFIVSSTQFMSIEQQLNSSGHQLISLERNLVDEVWLDRPALGKNKIFPISMKYSGRDILYLYRVH